MAKTPLDQRDRQMAEPTAGTEPVAVSGPSEIDQFLTKVRTMTPRGGAERRGRLIFAMDATMSRQPTWDIALSLQAGMFEAVAAIGGLDVQLVYFRGFGEARASRWVSDPRALAAVMSKVECQGGRTQIERMLRHALKEHTATTVNAFVYVGDAMEEAVDDLAQHAGEMGLRHLPAFVFQEGRDGTAAQAFREIARLSGGAYCAFNAGASAELKALLSAVAAYAAGGRRALEALADGTSGGAGARLLLEQLGR